MLLEVSLGIRIASRPVNGKGIDRFQSDCILPGSVEMLQRKTSKKTETSGIVDACSNEALLMNHRVPATIGPFESCEVIEPSSLSSASPMSGVTDLLPLSDFRAEEAELGVRFAPGLHTLGQLDDTDESDSDDDFIDDDDDDDDDEDDDDLLADDDDFDDDDDEDDKGFSSRSFASPAPNQS